jgi:hypothetical protein
MLKCAESSDSVSFIGLSDISLSGRSFLVVVEVVLAAAEAFAALIFSIYACFCAFLSAADDIAI